ARRADRGRPPQLARIQALWQRHRRAADAPAKIRFSTTRSSLMLDPNTALPSNEQYGINASYQLIEVATGKIVLNATTFARTSYDIPGQFQRFARARASRDAEDRAAEQI